MDELKTLIRNVPDFPKPGIGFKDITTLLKDKKAFRKAVKGLCDPYRKNAPDLVVGIEARGFILGAAAALELGAGFVPIRKPKKLPADVLRETYTLEYGTDTIEMHSDAISAGQRVLLVDDLLATGGTAAAASALIRKAGGRLIGASFLVELAFLKGRNAVHGLPIHSLVVFEEEA